MRKYTVERLCFDDGYMLYCFENDELVSEQYYPTKDQAIHHGKMFTDSKILNQELNQNLFNGR